MLTGGGNQPYFDDLINLQSIDVDLLAGSQSVFLTLRFRKPYEKL